MNIDIKVFNNTKYHKKYYVEVKIESGILTLTKLHKRYSK